MAPTDEPQGNSKLKLPSLKDTFSSVFSNTEKEDDQELHNYQTQPKGVSAISPAQIAIPRRDAALEVSQIPAARVGTGRDDLEKGDLRI